MKRLIISLLSKRNLLPLSQQLKTKTYESNLFYHPIGWGSPNLRN